jgi:hypothetical protein
MPSPPSTSVNETDAGFEPVPFPPLGSVNQIKARFEACLSEEPPGLDRRKLWLLQLAELMMRIATLRRRQAASRNIDRVAARLAASVTAVVTALTGGTLLAGVHGSAAKTLGVAAIILGIGGSVLTALRPAESYATNLIVAVQYERLWWAIYGYCSTELVKASEADFAKAWTDFNNREQDISSTPGSGGVTAGISSASQDSS